MIKRMKTLEHFFKGLIRFIKKPIVIILLILIAGGFLWYTSFVKKDISDIEYITAEKGELVQEVSVIGRVKPTRSVNLAFEKSGRVSWINAIIGDKVFVGQTLVQLENGDIVAQLAQAKASVKEQQAKFDELQRGSRSEEIQVQQVKVENARISLQDSKQNLVDVLNEAYSKSEDAVRDKADQLFSNPRSSNPKIVLGLIIDSILENTLERERFTIEETLIAWKTSFDGLTIESDLQSFIDNGRRNLTEVKVFLADAGLAMSEASPNTDLSQAIIDAWGADVSTARTNVNAAITNVSSAVEELQDANSALALAEQELALKEAGATPEQTAAQEAKLEQVQATVKQYEAELRKTVITAPISGVVTKQEAKVGEIVPVNTTMVTLISASQFEIQANIPEADIAKLGIGDTATFTLDAYGEDTIFDAVIFSIDPAETVIEGVSTYEIALQFAGKEDEVKSGMTANVDILTDMREEVIAVPGRAIISKNGEKFVRILQNNREIEERKVKTGLRGSDGRVEIIDGIEVGEKVIVFQKNEPH